MPAQREQPGIGDGADKVDEKHPAQLACGKREQAAAEQQDGERQGKHDPHRPQDRTNMLGRQQRIGEGRRNRQHRQREDVADDRRQDADILDRRKGRRDHVEPRPGPGVEIGFARIAEQNLVRDQLAQDRHDARQRQAPQPPENHQIGQRLHRIDGKEDQIEKRVGRQRLVQRGQSAAQKLAHQSGEQRQAEQAAEQRRPATADRCQRLERGKRRRRCGGCGNRQSVHAFIPFVSYQRFFASSASDAAARPIPHRRVRKIGARGVLSMEGRPMRAPVWHREGLRRGASAAHHHHFS